MKLLLKNKTLKNKTLKNNYKGGGFVGDILKKANTFILKKFIFSYIKKLLIVPTGNDDIIDSIIDKKVIEISDKLLEYQLRTTERLLYIMPGVGNMAAVGTTAGTAVMGALKIKNGIFEVLQELKDILKNSSPSNSDIDTLKTSLPEIIKRGGRIALENVSVSENKMLKGGGRKNKKINKKINTKKNTVNRINKSIDSFLNN